jgi:hypothetical protein
VLGCPYAEDVQGPAGAALVTAASDRRQARGHERSRPLVLAVLPGELR